MAGNLIGTDFTGTTSTGADLDPLGNRGGLRIQFGASNNTIGGTTSATRNIISGNDQSGVLISRNNGDGVFPTGNVVQGNRIGTDISGAINLGNGGPGVDISHDASGNTIGGTDPGAGNLISRNGNAGIRIETGNGASGYPTGNSILDAWQWHSKAISTGSS